MPEARRVEFVGLATRDLDETFEYIAQYDEQTAFKQVDEIRRVCHERLAANPNLDKPLKMGGGRRSFLKNGYRIVNRADDMRLLVLRIIHTSMNFDRIMSAHEEDSLDGSSRTD